ncbi:MAG: hypothetical protein PHH36_11815 [Sideroxydans sp.]|nr:hypothetical protein [Sideroxydans sp.]
MTQQQIELLITLLISGLAITVVSRMDKGKKKDNPRNYYMGKGQLFDHHSIRGNANSILLGLLVCIVGWNIDEIGRWLWHQFGNELIVSHQKESWHRMVAMAIGLGITLISLLQLISVLRTRNRYERAMETEQLQQVQDSRKCVNKE